MLTAKATLIQDIRDFLEVISPVLKQHSVLDNPAIKKRFLEWLIAREMSLCYMLFDERILASSEASRFTNIYNELNHQPDFALSPVFAYFIKAPKLYDESEIRISVQHMQLHIDYYRNFKPYFI